MANERVDYSGLTEAQIARLRELYGDEDVVDVSDIKKPLLDLREEEFARIDEETTRLIKEGHSITLSVPRDGTVLRVAQTAIGANPARFTEAKSIEQALMDLTNVAHDPSAPAGNKHSSSKRINLPMAGDLSSGSLEDALLAGWWVNVHFSPNAGKIGAELTKPDGSRAFALGESFSEAVSGAIEIITPRVAESTPTQQV